MAGTESRSGAQEYIAWYVDGNGRPFAVGVHGFSEDEILASQSGEQLTAEQIAAAEASGRVLPAIPLRAMLERVIDSTQNGTR